MKNVLFRNEGLLIAGPTAGKTFFQQECKKKGSTVVDIDEIRAAIHPNWPSLGIYRTQDEKSVALRKMLDVMVAERVMLRHPEDLIVSNLWSEDFLRTLFGSGKPSLYVGVLDWKVMVERSKLRGTPFSEGLCRKWQERLVIEVPRVFKHFIFLPGDKYLADVVAVHKGHFVLTKLGLSLLDVIPPKPGPFFQATASEEGGSNV
jgi:hypothetical protein